MTRPQTRRRHSRVPHKRLLAPILALAGLMSAGGAGFAAEAAPASTFTAPAPVEATIAKLTGGKAKVLHAFKAPSGLIGVAFTEGKGRDGIVYVSPDGNYVFRGIIIKADGSNVTQQEAAQFLPKPPGAAENFAALDKTHTYLWGQKSAKKELWIVFDPNCIYCHKTYESLEKYVADGTLKVHIIQVGFLKPSSLGKAAAILSTKNPADGLKTDESKFDVANEEGGIKSDMSDAQAVKQVKENNTWMSDQEIGGTPYLLYRNAQGKPEAAEGYVADVATLLSKIQTNSGTSD